MVVRIYFLPPPNIDGKSWKIDYIYIIAGTLIKLIIEKKYILGKNCRLRTHRLIASVNNVREMEDKLIADWNPNIRIGKLVSTRQKITPA